MDHLLDITDLENLFAELDSIEDTPEDSDTETLASQRRYEEIIKKHKAE